MSNDRRQTLILALVQDGYAILERRNDHRDTHTWGITARKGEYELTIEEYPVNRKA